MRHKTILQLFAILAAFLAISFCWPGCSEKITNDRLSDGPTVTVRVEFSIAAGVESLDRFRLIIEADDMETDTVLLELQEGYLVGAVEVPAGLGRHFTVEALDKLGVVIYRGATIADVRLGTTTEVNINLYPVAPLVNLTPHYTRVVMDSGFFVDISVHLVPELYSIDFNLSYSDGPVYFDTIVKGPGLDEGSSLTYSISYPTALIQVFRTSPGVLVDESGYAHLATCYFGSYSDYGDSTATVILQVEPLLMTSYQGARIDTIPLENIYTDQAVVELYRGVTPLNSALKDN